MELTDLLDWAWQRHHNPLSWYVRPLFLIPFAFFAWAKLGRDSRHPPGARHEHGLVPAPRRVDPGVQEFLAVEREWLLGTWTLAKVAFSATVPLFFLLLGAAFWRRAWWLGVLVMAMAALGKVLWSFSVGDDSARAVVAPAVLGLVLCVLAVIIGARRAGGRSEVSDRARSTGVA